MTQLEYNMKHFCYMLLYFYYFFIESIISQWHLS